MGCKNSKIPKPKLSGGDPASTFPYVRGSKDARVRSIFRKVSDWPWVS